MRKAGTVVLVILGVIIAALLVIPKFLDVNRYRGRIQAELEQRLGRTVSLGEMHLALLPPSFQVDNAVIGEDPRFGQGPFASVQELDVAAKLGPLVHGNIEVSSLNLKRPKFELIRNSEGVWNFSTLGHQAPEAAGKPRSPEEQRAFSLDKFKLSDGKIAVTDLQKHQSRAVYDHIDLSLKDFAPGKPFSISVAAHLPGKGTQTLSLDATAGPISEATLVNTPLSGTIKLSGVDIAGLQEFLNTQALAGTSAVISGTTRFKNESGKLSSEGSLKIENARVRGVEIGYPIDADYNVSDDLTSDVIHVAKGDIKLGGTPLAITGTLNTRAVPAQIDVRLNAANVSIAEAARLAAAFGVAFSPNTKAEGRLSADVRAHGASAKPLLEGKLSAADVLVSGRDLPQPIKVPSLELALSPQDIRSNDFNAIAGGTNVGVRFTLAQYTTPSPLVEVALRTSNANIAELLNMARAYGAGAVDGITGSGTLSLDVHASGPLKNASAMVFSGNGQVQNASIKTSQLREPLNLHSVNLQFNRNSATLQNLAVSLGQTNASGALTVNNFAAPQVQFTLAADKVNLVELQTITGNASTSAPAPQRRADFWGLLPRAYAQNAPLAAGPAPAPGILSKLTGGGTVNIGTLLYDQLVLNNVHSNVALDHGVIRLAPLSAQLYEGQESGAIVVDTRTSPMTINVSSKMTGVKANELISSVSSLKNTIYGLLAANAQSNFTITNTSDIARSLNGSIALDLSNGRIAKIDLLNQLASIGKFAGFTKNAQPFTDVLKLTGNFDIRNGVATTNNLQAAIDGGTLAAAGVVNLVNQSLDLHLTAVLSKAMSDRVGGNNIGGFMTTALANNRGELVMPVLISGTFDQPRFAPDVQKIAEMKMQNLLPSTSNPGQLTTAILGSALKGGSAGQAQRGGIGGVVGAITGQQQQQQPQQPQGQQPVAAPPQQQQQQNANPFQQAIEGVIGGKKKQQQQPPPPSKPPQ